MYSGLAQRTCVSYVCTVIHTIIYHFLLKDHIMHGQTLYVLYVPDHDIKNDKDDDSGFLLFRIGATWTATTDNNGPGFSQGK